MRTELPEDWTSCFFLLLHVLTVALEPYVGVREVKSVLELGESSQHVAKVLDVRFISSLPVMQRPACMAWADKRRVQIVWAEG